MSSSPSSIYNWSVRVQFPSRDICRREQLPLLLPPLLERALGQGGRTWSSRGWATGLGLKDEISAALDRDPPPDGIVIARWQKKEEADALVEKLTELNVTAFLESYFLIVVIDATDFNLLPLVNRHDRE